jgi:plasmid stability protein
MLPGLDGKVMIDHIDITLISQSRLMVDILVRNVDEDTARRLKEKAKASGKSLSETVRETLNAAVKPSKAEAWAAADAFRKKIGKVSGDSTRIIREWRDNKERYR